MRILFVTGLYSPFQVEVASAANRHDQVEYHVAFTLTSAHQRGGHWFRAMEETDRIHIRPSDVDIEIWTAQKLNEIAPEIIIVGGYRGQLVRLVRSHLTQNRNVRVGLWAEMPNPSNQILTLVKSAYANISMSNFDFALAIGDRAFDFYSKRVPPCCSFLIPYGQDLSDFMNIERVAGKAATRLRFLFSGRLVEQHNIQKLVGAVCDVIDDKPSAFEFVVAAHGPEQKHIDFFAERSEAFRQAIRYDRDYEKWLDRLVPFSYSDVFLYPSHHSGWGLVVPEAMAAGMLVVSSRNVEAARYLIQPGIDGFLIETSRASIAGAMRWCLNNPSIIRSMGDRARSKVAQVSAGRIAENVIQAIETVTRY